MKYTSLLKISVLMSCLWLNVAFAVPITTSVDTSNPENDVKPDINLSTLLPIAEGNTWTYNLEQSTGLEPPAPNTNKTVVADVGQREEIGGGCLRLQPIVFGDELVLYLGNHGDSLSLYGIYLSHWQGLEDVLLKFETRSRVEWRDFQNRYISNEITPIDQNSCQDTGWGRVERTGLVLLEDLTLNWGEPGNQRGQIDCKVKNTDLRDNFTGGQRGSGLALVRGQTQTLTWIVEAMNISESGGNVNIQMHFRPIIHSSATDYSMHFDISLTQGQGITELWITDDGSNVVDDVYDLHYDQAVPNLVSGTNLVTPGGNCPEDSGRLVYLLCLLSLGLTFSRRRSVS